MKKLAIGIDIGGTSIKFGLVDENGELIFENSISTKGDFRETFSKIKAEIDSFATAENLDTKFISGIGVGLPGPVTSDNKVTTVPVNIKNWPTAPLDSLISNIFNLPVQMGNDATVAAFGEQWVEKLDKKSPFLMITLGTGVGGGIIVNGVPVFGSQGFGGEIGHVNIAENGVTCNCGGKGCLETMSSATAIIRMYKEKTGEELTAKNVSVKARAGDIDAIDCFNKAGNALGKAIANFIKIIDPEVIVLGGQLSKSFDLMQDQCIKAIKENFWGKFSAEKIVVTELPKGIGIIGAAKLALG